ncbi:MAG TPA: hypothetical protein VHC46_01850 [Thermodesulfobacteriota bacterium]|nr:hypothetical protein [Thermodesulfobacteriota bacterium]
MKGNGHVRENIDSIRDEVERLKHEFSSVSENILDISRKAYKSGNRKLGREAARLHRELGSGLKRARKAGSAGIGTVEERIVRKPLLSLLIAFFAGVLAGKLMGRE